MRASYVPEEALEFVQQAGFKDAKIIPAFAWMFVQGTKS